MVEIRGSLAGGVLLMTVASASLSGCAAMTPGAPHWGAEDESILISPTDARYRSYLVQVGRMIKEKWSYPCVKNEAAGSCQYKASKLEVEIALLENGQVARVTVSKKAEWEIYDEFAVNAIHQASPFPPVPAALLATAKPGSAEVPIKVRFTYKLVELGKPNAK
jgi:TonB family protein